ncbi:MAG: methyltransferase [Pyrinomonadaceae bacterium]
MNTTIQAKPEVPPQAAMLNIINGFWISRAVYIIAKLGIPDILRDGARTAEELAQATNTHAQSLFRVLRALASVGVVAVEDDNRFRLTPLSETLVTDAQGSLRWFVISELGEEHYSAWEDVIHSVRTGEIAFDHHFGMPVWEFFSRNPENAALFNNSMSSMTAAVNAAIASVYDFSLFKNIVDVGGGHGGLITAVLSVNPNLQGVLFDAPQVIEGSSERIAAAGLSERCETVGGDFFESVPAGGDCYILKWIIHDWNDEQSITILKNCRNQMTPDGRLILVEAVVPESNEPHFAKFIDLNMLVMTGGKERTAREYEQLLATAGFKVNKILPSDLPTSVIEAQPI